MKPLAKIKIVLVEPAGALNVGSIARIMKNMCLSQLVLVNPQCDPHGDEARKMAVHAVDILERAVTVDSLPAALAGCQRAIATTARHRSLPTKLESPQAALPWLLTPNLNAALIFGAEARGLSNRELKYAQRFVCIDSNPVYPSLNLAQAVAICAYELHQSWQHLDDENASPVVLGQGTVHNPESYVTVQKKESSDSVHSGVEVAPIASCESNFPANSAPLEVIEAYYQHLETVLLDIGYLYPHTATARMDKFRRLYNRANLTDNEVAMLRGILRQIQWSINNSSPKK